ncbi:MAG: hypothetical protein IJT38_00520 [Clostridia bacterium]|nr:hypothetical protein [Clostridia bacterium]
MSTVIVVYAFIFLSDFMQIKGDKNGRWLLMLSSAVGISVLLLLQSDIKITTPAVHIMNFLEYLGLHY